jgi:hypothetical protein
MLSSDMLNKCDFLLKPNLELYIIICYSSSSFEGASWEYLEKACDWTLEDGEI